MSFHSDRDGTDLRSLVIAEIHTPQVRVEEEGQPSFDLQDHSH